MIDEETKHKMFTFLNRVNSYKSKQHKYQMCLFCKKKYGGISKKSKVYYEYFWGVCPECIDKYIKALNEAKDRN